MCIIKKAAKSEGYQLDLLGKKSRLTGPFGTNDDSNLNYELVDLKIDSFKKLDS